jgi:hypothetical protein
MAFILTILSACTRISYGQLVSYRKIKDTSFPYSPVQRAIVIKRQRVSLEGRPTTNSRGDVPEGKLLDFAATSCNDGLSPRDTACLIAVIRIRQVRRRKGSGRGDLQLSEHISLVSRQPHHFRHQKSFNNKPFYKACKSRYHQLKLLIPQI